MKHKTANQCTWRSCRYKREAGCNGRCQRHHDIAQRSAATQRERLASERARLAALSVRALGCDEFHEALIAKAESIADARHGVAMRLLLGGSW